MRARYRRRTNPTSPSWRPTISVGVRSASTAVGSFEVEPPTIVEATRGETPRIVKPYDLETRKPIDGELNERASAFMENNGSLR